MSLTAAQARKIALSFDGAFERHSQGGPEIRIGDDYFVRIGTREPDTVQFKLDSFEERDAMIAAEPHLFYITDHWKSYKGLLARLSALDAKTMRALLKQRLAVLEAQKVSRKKKAR
ncbi:MAG: hypothetical protein ISS15_18480 [Alphaproteobacteria bacterium]|nr:hypothetical protein [Alphaproteobacteria bacterium]MBL6939057.1 hypothetical protein [Alphaproteobacteria bacterium]MBL7099649.1 hypothetical protein [Alphaproteobacteria bacterium]